MIPVELQPSIGWCLESWKISVRSLLKCRWYLDTFEQTPHLLVIAQTVRMTLLQCNEILDSVREELQLYQGSLEKETSENALKKTIVKLHWHFSDSGHLGKFRHEIRVICTRFTLDLSMIGA